MMPQLEVKYSHLRLLRHQLVVMKHNTLQILMHKPALTKLSTLQRRVLSMKSLSHQALPVKTVRSLSQVAQLHQNIHSRVLHKLHPVVKVMRFFLLLMWLHLALMRFTQL